MVIIWVFCGIKSVDRTFGIAERGDPRRGTGSGLNKKGHNLLFPVIIEISRHCFCILEVEGESPSSRSRHTRMLL